MRFLRSFDVDLATFWQLTLSVCHAVTRSSARPVSHTSSNSYLPKLRFYSGQQNLGQACPICLHEPVNAEDCKPNKALRTTVKVWLKKRSTERDAAIKREMASRAPPTPITPTTPALNDAQNQQNTNTLVALSDGVTENGISKPLYSREASVAHSPNAASAKLEEQHEANKDIPEPSIEVSCVHLV